MPKNNKRVWLRDRQALGPSEQFEDSAPINLLAVCVELRFPYRIKLSIDFFIKHFADFWRFSDPCGSEILCLSVEKLRTASS